MGWGDRASDSSGREVTINGRRIVVPSADPTGEEIRRAAGLDESRLLIDGETRQIIGPSDRPVTDELYDAPRFSKGSTPRRRR